MTDDRAADRLAIGELIARYAWGLADKDWAAWQACFTADAHVDYSTAGGIAGSAVEAAAWLEATLSMFDVTLSHTGNVVVDFTGDDTANVRSLYKMVMRIPGATPTFMEASGFYRDRVIRTTSGWRIADRFEQLLYLR
jgi:3-phenylpropionate/cinnamic acid dioxygenase small subunit